MKLMQMLMYARGFSPNPPVAMQQYHSTASYSQMMGCDASTGAPAYEPSILVMIATHTTRFLSEESELYIKQVAGVYCFNCFIEFFKG